MPFRSVPGQASVAEESEGGKLFAPSAARNLAPLLEVVERHAPPKVTHWKSPAAPDSMWSAMREPCPGCNGNQAISTQAAAQALMPTSPRRACRMSYRPQLLMPQHKDGAR